MINPDMLDPNSMVNVKRDEIEEMKPSPVSMMPEGLLNTLHHDEVLDLIAYLLSRGDRQNPMFARKCSDRQRFFRTMKRPTMHDDRRPWLSGDWQGTTVVITRQSRRWMAPTPTDYSAPPSSCPRENKSINTFITAIHAAMIAPMAPDQAISMTVF